MLSAIPPAETVASKALPLSIIKPTSGNNLPYDPAVVVYPLVFFAPVDSTPKDPDTKS